MAIRIRNCGRHRLRLDLPGGQVLSLAPNETSPALREEHFYDNVYLRHWLADGTVRVMDAPMSEVLARERLAPRPPADEKTAAGDAAPVDENAGADEAPQGGARERRRKKRS